jgi:hypothetical protein
MYLDHQYPPTVARYAPSGFYIASADTTGTVRIWDTTQKEHICKLETKAMGGMKNLYLLFSSSLLLVTFSFVCYFVFCLF